MARAMNVPVVGLYGSTNPKRSGPFRRYTELVVDGYARTPEEEYPVSPRRRLAGKGRITPEKVLDRVALAVEKYGRDSDKT
jgi:heptosyltransferase I